MNIEVITQKQISARSYWIDEISRLSGNFGVDAEKVEDEINKEIKDNGIDALLGHLRLCGAIPDHLRERDIEKIVKTYRDRPEKAIERYARRVSMEEIEKNDFNLNISRYVSTAKAEKKIDLQEVHTALTEIEKKATASAAKHNKYLKELGLKTI